MRDPNLRFVDLDGDGHADVLITEDDAFVWHASLAEEGFGPARRVAQALDEETGPRVVFADGTQSIYLADLSGDGLTDIVRIRNGEVCYWPNLGYGRFGAKVTMDNAPWFDHPDQFDHKRIRLADIDGSGTTDIIYLHRDGVRLYFNQSGNSWSKPQQLKVFPRVDDVVSIVPVDLLGNGTACLVWSSALARRRATADALRQPDGPAEAAPAGQDGQQPGRRDPRRLRPLDQVLPAGQARRSNPGSRGCRSRCTWWRRSRPTTTSAATASSPATPTTTATSTARSASSAASAWWSSGTRRSSRLLPRARFRQDNIAAASHVPPVRTKTWFHTGVYLGRDHVSDFFAGLLNQTDKGEYFREPGLTDPEAASPAAAGHGPSRRPDSGRGARSLPRPQGLDAAPGGLRR